MKKKMKVLASILTMVLGMHTVVYASPQKPFDWQGTLGANTLDFNENTCVEMKNGDGTDVLSVSGRYIAEHSIKDWNGFSAYPVTKNGTDHSLPDNVDSVHCQIVKEDAYFIMPFDGFVSILLCDEVSGGYSGGVCVRAKAGDKINMVPRNLVYTYMTGGLYQDVEKTTYGNTTADDWTYSLRIYKEALLPLAESPYPPKANEKRRIAGALDHPYVYSCLWFLYQVDAPNTEVKAKEVTEKDVFNDGINKKLDDNGNPFTGWLESSEMEGIWKYYRDGRQVRFSVSDFNHDLYESDTSGYFFVPESYKDYLTVQDGDIYIEGYKVNARTGEWMDPKYNIVNVQ